MNPVLPGRAEQLPLRSSTVACFVTSPPYNVNLDGYPDAMTWGAYRRMAGAAAMEMRRTAIPGARVWVNVQATVPAIPGNPGGPRVDLARIWTSALVCAGFTYRDTVVWLQDAHDGACAWGSWLQPSAPNLRGGHELILCYSAGEWYRDTPAKWRKWRAPKEELGGEWMDLVRNVWTMRPERRRDDAPAPFPLALPARAIRLSTWPGELVVDPFAGSGTTMRAADELGRPALGFDRYAGA